MTHSIQPRQLLNRLIYLGKQSLVKNAGYLMGISLVNTAVGFLFWGMAARLYPPEEVGLTSAVISAASLLVGVTDFGMSIGLVRYLPGNDIPVRFLNSIFLFEVITSILAGAAFLAGISIWSPSLLVLRNNWVYLAGFLIYLTFFTLCSIVSRAFIARRKSLFALILNSISNGSRLVFVILLAGFGSVGLFGSLSIAYTLAASISLTFLLPKIEPGYQLRPAFDLPILSRILPYSLGNYIVGLFYLISPRLMPLIVIEILGPASSGYFYIAWMISEFITSPTTALSDAALAEGSNSPEQLNTHLIRSIKIGLGITVPAAVIGFFAAPFILGIFGPLYAQEATNLLRFLAVTSPMIFINGIYFTNLRVKKQIKQLVLVNAVFAMLALGISFVLLRRLGITAFGIGWFTGVCFLFVVAIFGFGWQKNVMRHIQNIGRKKDPHSLDKLKEF